MSNNNTVIQTHSFIMCTGKGLLLTNDSLDIDLYSSSEGGYNTAAEKTLYLYVLPVICSFGIFGNILNLVILSRKSLTVHMEKLERCGHSHLIALAVSDLMYCVTALPRTFKPLFAQASYISPWLLYDAYHGAVINTFLLCSSWLTVAMAVSRYIAICYPMKARQHLGIRTTRMSIVCIFIISVIFNVPRYFQKAIHRIQCQEGGYSYYIYHGPLHTNTHGEHIYLWIYFVVGIMFPLLAVAFCNIFFFRALRASMKLHRSSCHYSSSSSFSSSNTPNILTFTLSIIVVLYILLVTPAEIIQFFKSYVMDQYLGNEQVLVSFSLASAICNNLQTLNFAVNFLLYCMINVHFRSVIMRAICNFIPSDHQQS